ncbi:hypothetical protein QYM36_002443 [Artemia franciscana]|uniref:Potassium channel domain-containing protein n=1 Tax=Artemia franciscana TaxID=6661 RepID=A0AA88I9T9_ARTSF|nr:hypothetical protein QYM36_002443 [Artemia franciscana]
MLCQQYSTFYVLCTPSIFFLSGYGNIAPVTIVGKIMTIFYAMIGMPIFLLYVSNIGDILATSFRWTYVKICLCGGKKKRSPSGSLGSDTDQGDPLAVTVPLTISVSIIVGYVYGGALLFMNWEDWDLLDSCYFCFISLSTIGFGDIVPGDSFSASDGVEPSLIFCSTYLIIGMALIAMCFNLMQEEVVAKIQRVGKAFGCVKSDE